MVDTPQGREASGNHVNLDAPTPQEGGSGQEPVAWLYRTRHLPEALIQKNRWLTMPDFWTETPLYAHPAPAPSHAALVEASRELRDLMQGVIDGDYKPDSFTLQPIDAALSSVQTSAGGGGTTEKDDDRSLAALEVELRKTRDFFRLLLSSRVIPEAVKDDIRFRIQEANDALHSAKAAGTHTLTEQGAATTGKLANELRRMTDLFEHALKTPGYGKDANSLEEAADAIVSARTTLSLQDAETTK